MIAPEIVEQAQLRVGQTLCGKWRLDRVIGVGGMASVYEATHRNKNRVAIKLLHPLLCLEAGTRERFLREGYVANTIEHRGAVRVLDDDTTEDGAAFLVMELLLGENVEQRALRRGGVLPPREALELIDQLLDLLSVAHDRNVIHRDIKPDNLFWTDDGELKLLDFGIARISQSGRGATTVGSFMGTPAFSAPEQARGRWDEVDERTDLFAVGATLFTLLTGAHVHEAETSSEQLALAISAPARSFREVAPSAPSALVSLIDKALSYDKKDRFQSARSFRTAVQQVAAGLPESLSLQHSSDRKSFFEKALPATPRAWLRLSSPLGRLALGGLASLLLALLLLWLGQEEGVGTTPNVSPRDQSSAGFRESLKETEMVEPPSGLQPSPQKSTATRRAPEEVLSEKKLLLKDAREHQATTRSARPSAASEPARGAPTSANSQASEQKDASGRVPMAQGTASFQVEDDGGRKAADENTSSKTEDLFDRRY